MRHSELAIATMLAEDRVVVSRKVPRGGLRKVKQFNLTRVSHRVSRIALGPLLTEAQVFFISLPSALAAAARWTGLMCEASPNTAASTAASSVNARPRQSHVRGR